MRIITLAEAKARLLAALDDGGLQVVDIERRDLERAAALCEAHASGLRTPDALHAAVAQRLRMTLITADRGQAAGCAFHAIDVDLLAVAHDVLVDGVVDDLLEEDVNPIVLSRSITQLADVHAGTKSDVFARVEGADVLFVVVGGHEGSAV